MKYESHSVFSWNDMERYGFNYLTGEACAYGFRGLIDLSAEGKDAIMSFLGLPPDTPMRENWNSMVGDKPAVASIMLPREVLATLAKFVLLHVHEADIVVEYKGGIYGYSANDPRANQDNLNFLRKDMEAVVLYNPRLPRTQGGRNVHSFTGRVE